MTVGGCGVLGSLASLVLVAGGIDPTQAQQRIPINERFADVNGVRLHYLVAGKGDPVMVFNGQHHGSAPSLKGISGGGIWQVSLSGELQPHESPALAAMIVEQPQTYRTAILATRAPVIRSFIRKFDTNA